MKNCDILSIFVSCIWVYGTVGVLAHSDSGEKGVSNGASHSHGSKGASHSHGKHSGRSGQRGQCTRRNISQNQNALEQCCRIFLDRLAKRTGGQASSGAKPRQKRRASRQKKIAFWKNFCETHTGGNQGNTAGTAQGGGNVGDDDDMNADQTSQAADTGKGVAVSKVQNDRGKGQSAAVSGDGANGSRSNTANQRSSGGKLSGASKDKSSSSGKDATSGGAAVSGGGVTE